jgi:hypothetical protein
MNPREGRLEKGNEKHESSWASILPLIHKWALTYAGPPPSGILYIFIMQVV